MSGKPLAKYPLSWDEAWGLEARRSEANNSNQGELEERRNCFWHCTAGFSFVVILHLTGGMWSGPAEAQAQPRCWRDLRSGGTWSPGGQERQSARTVEVLCSGDRRPCAWYSPPGPGDCPRSRRPPWSRPSPHPGRDTGDSQQGSVPPPSVSDCPSLTTWSQAGRE